MAVNSRRRTRAGGFTLVELLVAMTIMALMMGLLFGGLRLASRAWNTTEQRLDQTAVVSAVQRFVRQRLTAARTLELPQIFDNKRRNQVIFSGGTARLTFISDMPANRATGLQLMVLTRRDNKLWLRYRPFVKRKGLFNDRSSAWSERRLLKGVSGLRFSYYGRPADADSAGWYQNWQGQTHLPTLIRVQLARPDSQRTQWPTLWARPRITEAPGRRPSEEGFGP